MVKRIETNNNNSFKAFKTNKNKYLKMKKITLAVASFAIALAISSCGNSTPKADLKTDVDTLSYAMGVAQTGNFKEVLSQRMGVDTAYINEFIKGVQDGANSGDDKKKAAYYAGLQVGQNLGGSYVKDISRQVFGEDTTKTISLKNFIAGFIDGATGKNSIMTAERGGQVAERLFKKIQGESNEKQYSANKKAGEAFLAANKKKPGVVTLPSGLQYKIIKAGNGATPSDTSMVKVHYEGRTIDGKVFESSYERKEPAQFRLNQVIKGWTEAIKLMPVGSVWEVYIPQDLAYGAQNSGPIKPFSTLIFKIELVGINGK